MPSHSAIKVKPVVPSQRRSLTSSAKIVGASSPSGMAVVIIRSAIPEPLPKCLSPVTAYERPTIVRTSSVGVAVALVRPISPPLPGSDVIVPHCSPAAALAKTARRCASHAGWVGSGLSSQNATTDGCIADTRPTAGSAAASRRSSSQTVRADEAVSRQRPPMFSGTTALRNPASRNASKSTRSRCRRAWRSLRSSFQVSAIDCMSSRSEPTVGVIGNRCRTPPSCTRCSAVDELLDGSRVGEAVGAEQVVA